MLNKSAALFQANPARMFQNSHATLYQNKFPNNPASKFPVSLVRPFLANNVDLYLANSAVQFPLENAKTCLLRYVALVEVDTEALASDTAIKVEVDSVTLDRKDFDRSAM